MPRANVGAAAGSFTPSVTFSSTIRIARKTVIPSAEARASSLSRTSGGTRVCMRTTFSDMMNSITNAGAMPILPFSQYPKKCRPGRHSSLSPPISHAICGDRKTASYPASDRTTSGGKELVEAPPARDARYRAKGVRVTCGFSRLELVQKGRCPSACGLTPGYFQKVND